MPDPTPNAEGAMSFLEHLDELRSRLLRSLVVFAIAFMACWLFSDRILVWLLRPIREHMFGGGDIVFIHITEPFAIYMKASALAGIFLASPYFLYQLWAFVAPGLYKSERRMVVPFLLFGTLFFITGGLFGYEVATPVAARWLLGLGEEFRANVTLRSAFQFQSRIMLGLGLVFELPVVIGLLARLGLVTPRFLLRHFRTAVLVIAILAAVLTPTGDIMTMAVFGAPMIGLYLLGIAVAWVFGRRGRAASEA
jgi:sec-independent protein translocase protein TatC